jgi:hypothetical protein
VDFRSGSHAETAHQQQDHPAKVRDEGKIRFSQPEKKIILYDSESIHAYLEQNARDTF